MKKQLVFSLLGTCLLNFKKQLVEYFFFFLPEEQLVLPFQQLGELPLHNPLKKENEKVKINHILKNNRGKFN